MGRHATNDLVIEDSGVSGVHMCILQVDGRVVVRDQSSTNGIWLGLVRIYEAEVVPGTELRIGESLLAFDTDDRAPVTNAGAHAFDALVGQSTAMREIFATLERIAPKDLAILVSGDTGTGKGAVARALHARSGRRAAGPFVELDATAVPEVVVERVLNERSAAAAGGTLYLDNVGELSATVQARLLRMLDESASAHDVRIVASSARDLRHAIEAGTFREDLYFRLAQVRITLPPLRDRLDDVSALANALLATIASPGGAPRLEEDALDWLRRQSWPGNVRELRNTLLAAAAVAEGGCIRRRDVAGEASHLGADGTLDLIGTFSDAKDLAIGRFEAAYLGALMSRCGGNLSLAARESHLARHHLRDLLKKRALYGLDWSAPPGDE